MSWLSAAMSFGAELVAELRELVDEVDPTEES
jgi:hypothetical protein